MVNLCSDSLCKNSGLCVANGLSYNCVCLPGYTGFDCSFVVNQCYSNPCLNGATCNNLGVNCYNCTCQPGFIGTNCEIRQDPCNSLPCQNDGTCIQSSLTTYQCK